MEKKIIEICYEDDNGNPQTRVVGELVEKITCHPAQGEGDKWFYEIYYKDGRIETIFNPRRTLTS